MTSAAQISTPAAPAGTALPEHRRLTVRQVLADPWVRLGLGGAVTLLTAAAARQHELGHTETIAFRLINDLPETIYRPTWVIMQAGALGAAPVTAGVAWLAGDGALARRLLTGGATAWALSKLVKHLVRRPRPATLLAATHCRGPEAAGLGYLSGHAGVAAALGTAALPHMGTAGRAVILGIVPIVALSRVYIGAHLPLDIAGGAALGITIDAALDLAQSCACHQAPPRSADRPGVSSARSHR
jgi:membrane-associated phospholipid phosphatase